MVTSKERAAAEEYALQQALHCESSYDDLQEAYLDGFESGYDAGFEAARRKYESIQAG